MSVLAPTVLCTCPQYVDERFIAPGLRLFQGENLEAVILSHIIYLDEQPAGSWMVLSGLCALAVESILRWMKRAGQSFSAQKPQNSSLTHL